VPQACAPSRVSEAVAYLLASSSATEEERRLATEAIGWLRSERDERTEAKSGLDNKIERKSAFGEMLPTKQREVGKRCHHPKPL